MKVDKKVMGILAIIFGVLIIFSPGLLSILVGVYLIINGLLSIFY